VGIPRQADPVNLVCAALAGRREWLDAARELLEARFGPIDLESEVWPWDFTDYYEAEMGGGLLRQLYGFRDLIDPGELAAAKLATNAMERKLACSLPEAPRRPVNLDPGYVAAGKLVLATTKNQAHRVFLGRGVYAECTLRWSRGNFEPWPWTYRDYRLDAYREFFARVRALYRGKLRSGRSG